MPLILLMLVLWGCEITPYYYIFDAQGSHIEGPYYSATACDIALTDIAMKYTLSQRPMPSLTCVRKP